MRRMSPLAGAAAIALPPLAVLMVLAAPDPRPRAGARPPGARSAPVADRGAAVGHSSRPALQLSGTTILTTRRTASRRLAVTGRRVAGCAARGAASGCDLWPLAHAAVLSRLDAAILANAAGPLPAGDCRARALGAAGTLRILAGEADELVFTRHDGSSSARARRRAAYLGVVGYLRPFLAPRGWRACAAGAAGAGPAA